MARGLTQEAFAAELGKSQGVLSRYESGKVGPPYPVFIHCMHILEPPSPAAQPTFGSAMSDVQQALVALQSAVQGLQRVAVLKSDTATGHVSHSTPSGER